MVNVKERKISKSKKPLDKLKKKNQNLVSKKSQKAPPKKNDVQRKKPQLKKNEKTAVKKRETEENSVCQLPIQSRPNLVLQLVYYLNDMGTKHVAIGFDPLNEFRLTVILSSNYSFVVMSTVDWFTFMLNIPEVHNYFNDIVQLHCSEFKTTKNIIMQKHNGDDKVLQIEDYPRTRSNNMIFLKNEEFTRCLELDAYLQPLIKQLQLYPQLILDYYNLYIYHCQTSNKQTLNDTEYFLPLGNGNLLDSFRLFKEIPIYCREKLDRDLSVPHCQFNSQDIFIV